ncbi:UNVERIFIED_CONTAM: hypothetical protein NCL1_39879 [Trichonephila clavipes]
MSEKCAEILRQEINCINSAFSSRCRTERLQLVITDNSGVATILWVDLIFNHLSHLASKKYSKKIYRVDYFEVKNKHGSIFALPRNYLLTFNARHISIVLCVSSI